MQKFILLILVLIVNLPTTSFAGCGKTGTWLQVLGSGGPELDDQRASSGYLIWHNSQAKILIDAGSGSMFRFEQSGAVLNDLDAILLSHLHVDHSNDLPSLIKASYFSGRTRDLAIYGPTGNHLMPATTGFIKALFDKEGAFKYLGSYLDGSDDYQLVPNAINANGKEQLTVVKTSLFQVTATPVHHGPIPTLAWRIDINNKSVVFSGDMNNDNNTLTTLASNADLLVAHHAIPEAARGAARNLHMPPSVIGKIATDANVKKLVLSHRMNRTLGKEKISAELIRRNYKGPLNFADDLHCFEL